MDAQTKFNAMLTAMVGDDLDAVVEVVVVDDSQLSFDLFDYDAEADDLAEDMLDRDFWARGQW